MNIPSNDPGVKLVPFVQTFCEWLVRLAGGIATCVEVSEMVSDHVATHGRIPVSAAEDTSLAQDLIARGEAAPNGATNYLAASEQMTRLGIPNTAYGNSWFGSNDFVPLVRAAIDRGVAVLFGIDAAYNLHDDWTNAAEDQGVQGHGICIVGYDNAGFIVADPNTVQAEQGNFVHYTAADLLKAGGGGLSMVIPEVSLGSPLDSYFTIAAGSYTLKSDTAIVLDQGELALFLQLQGGSGLPRMLTSYTLQKKYNDSRIAFRVYERMVFLYDPNHVKDKVAGFGDWMPAHIDDPDFGVASAPVDTNEVTDLKNKLQTLTAAVTSVDGAIQTALKAVA